MANQYTWGSEEWRTHMRRKLAQRKRWGEEIRDIEGLIDYIEKQGPAPERNSSMDKSKSAKKKTTTLGNKRRKVATVTTSKTPVAEKARLMGDGAVFASPNILRIKGGAH